jgi:DNA-binding NarL/FixJ family response regulator
MPGVNGTEAFRRIRAIRGDTKVVLMSGYNDEEATGRFAGKGLAGFVQKPFSPAQLMAEIRRVIEGGTRS